MDESTKVVKVRVRDDGNIDLMLSIDGYEMVGKLTPDSALLLARRLISVAQDAFRQPKGTQH